MNKGLLRMDQFYFLTANSLIWLAILVNHFHHKKHLKHIDKVHKNIANQMMDISLMMEKLKKDVL
jgi:hypothetical protein